MLVYDLLINSNQVLESLHEKTGDIWYLDFQGYHIFKSNNCSIDIVLQDKVYVRSQLNVIKTFGIDDSIDTFLNYILHKVEPSNSNNKIDDYNLVLSLSLLDFKSELDNRMCYSYDTNLYFDLSSGELVDDDLVWEIEDAHTLAINLIGKINKYSSDLYLKNNLAIKRINNKEFILYVDIDSKYKICIGTNYEWLIYDSNNNLLITYTGLVSPDALSEALKCTEKHLLVNSSKSDINLDCAYAEYLASEFSRNLGNFLKGVTFKDGKGHKDFYDFHLNGISVDFRILKLKDDLFSLVCTTNGKHIFDEDFSDVTKLVSIGTSYFNILRPYYGSSIDLNSQQNFDDEEISLQDSKFINLETCLDESLVSDSVEVMTVVALILDGKAVAYRFKTNEGYFDMTKKVALNYGINGFKIEKAIRLQRYNGMLLTQSELNNKKCIPDISNNDEDCRRLFNALFDV